MESYQINKTRRITLILWLNAIAYGAVAVMASTRGLWILFVMLVPLLAMGRLASYYKRDFRSCMQALGRGDAAAAIDPGERFVANIRSQPWRRYLIHFNSWQWKHDIGATAHMALAAAYRALGENGQSASHLVSAYELDPSHPEF